jgi:hypothetical protein
MGSVAEPSFCLQPLQEGDCSKPIVHGCIECKAYDALEVQGNKLFNSYTNTTPALVHGSGPAVYDKVYRHFESMKDSKRADIPTDDFFFYLGNERKELEAFCGPNIEYKVHEKWPIFRRQRG